jgi:hypothetical protein
MSVARRMILKNLSKTLCVKSDLIPQVEYYQSYFSFSLQYSSIFHLPSIQIYHMCVSVCKKHSSRNSVFPLMHKWCCVHVRVSGEICCECASTLYMFVLCVS